MEQHQDRYGRTYSCLMPTAAMCPIFHDHPMLLVTNEPCKNDNQMMNRREAYSVRLLIHLFRAFLFLCFVQ